MDHPLEDRNTIEMQSITALAHLKSAILFFMDPSEQCGYSLEQQCHLYHSLKPLFVNKPVYLVLNKNDSVTLEMLNPEEQNMIMEIVEEGVKLVSCSCFTDDGIMNIRNDVFITRILI